MPTTVTKSIGTSSRDYSTLQAWEDACPSNLVTADQIWKGECYNDSEFTACLLISGTTTDSTRYLELTAASGQSFQDHASVRSNALYYNQSNGVGISTNTASTASISITGGHVKISRLQIKQAAQAACYENTANTYATLKDCIIHQGNTSGAYAVTTTDPSSNLYVLNNLIFCTGSTGHIGIRFYSSTGSPTCEGNTVVSVSGTTANIGIYNVAGSPLVRSNIVFGFTTAFQQSGVGWGASSGYNTTNAASAPGSNNQTSKTAANQFESATNDFRLKTGADAIDTGYTDATYTPNDISGTVRGTTTAGDAGAWEYTSSGYTLTATGGTFPITGTAATLRVTRYLSVSSGSHPISGTAATLKVSYLLTAASGSHHISGTAATLFYGKQMAAASGSFPISGTAATFRRTYIMTASSGSVPITGTAATLTYAEVSSASAGSGIITRLYCPVCDRRVRRSELRKRWDGLLVCPEDWEPRHPSTFYRQRPERMQKVLPLPDSQPTLYTPAYANGWSVSGSVVDTGGYFVDGAGYTNVVIHPNPYDVACLCTAGGTITTPNSVTTAGTGTIFNTKTGRLLSLVTISSGQITTATPFASTTDPIVVRGRYIH